MLVGSWHILLYIRISVIQRMISTWRLKKFDMIEISISQNLLIRVYNYKSELDNKREGFVEKVRRMTKVISFGH